MDLLTQAVLGAATAAAAAPARETRLAAAVGAFAGVLPDADALIRSADDPLLVLEYHRHFSHALLFVPLGALIAALLAWPLARRRLGFARLYGYALLGYCLAGLLDACTSYGTHLLWPFSDAAVAWSIVAIVDPLFTLMLAAPLLAALLRRRAGVARVGLLLAATYLALGAWQQQRAADVAAELARGRGDFPERLLVKPTIGNILLWRSVYQARGVVHVDAVRVGPGGGVRVYPGASAPLLAPASVPGVPAGSRLADDVARFHRFADGWTVLDGDHPGFVGDARYAMLPTSLAPLWGIETDGPADAAAPFVSRRELTADMRQRFVDMLLGREP